MTCTYSSAACPDTFTMVRVSCAASQGRVFSQNASTPGFCKPMEFSMPDGVSAMRGVGLPSQGVKETPLVVMAPRRATSKKSAYSLPEPKVPEASVTGFFIRRPPKSTASAGASWASSGAIAAFSFTRPPPRRQRPGRRRTRGAGRPRSAARTTDRRRRRRP